MIKYEPIRWIFVGFGFISDGLKSILTIQIRIVPTALFLYYRYANTSKKEFASNFNKLLNNHFYE